MLDRKRKARNDALRRLSKKFIASGLALSLLLLFSCEDKMEDYYAKPDWLRGNIFKTLEDDGNYSVFLKGIELSGYRQMVDGKSILTVMAPNDSAFHVYLKDNYGTENIEDLSEDELKKLIGFHIMYYSYGPDRLINFRPEGDDVSKEDKEVMAGMYYKHRTRSSDKPTKEFYPRQNDSVLVYHMERYLPVFSYRYFSTKQIDPVYNYEYFFPDTRWSGGTDGFNVANAAVEKTPEGKFEIIASNGYVYKVDRVLKPLETIYTELRARPSDFSIFLEKYDQNKRLVYDEKLSTDFGNGERLYLIEHSPFPPIAFEWPVTDHTVPSLLTSVGYSIFAPTNQAFTNFFDDYWKVGGYESLAEVSQESMGYVIENSFYFPSAQEQMNGKVVEAVFPEQIKKGEIKSLYDMPILFDVDAVPYENRILCENGVLYGCDILAPPAFFSSVTGPAFQYKKFSYFLKMLTNNGNDMNTVKTFSSNETRFLMLMPSNDLITEAGITASLPVGATKEVLMRGTSPLGGLQEFTNSHSANLAGTIYTEIPQGGVHVLRTMRSDERYYWYIINGKLTTSMKFRELILPNPPALEDMLSNIEELQFRGEEWTNGKMYAYDNALFEAVWNENPLVPQPSFQQLMINLGKNDESVLYHGFVNLLDKAGLYTGSTLNFIIAGEQYFSFVPTTEAIKSALEAGKIPGVEFDPEEPSTYYFDRYKVTDAAALQGYLKTYFLPLTTAEMTNFPYVGWGETPNRLPSLNEYLKEADGKVALYAVGLEIRDTGSKLQVRVKEDGHNFIDVVGNYYYLPFVFQDAGVHFIDTCFDVIN